MNGSVSFVNMTSETKKKAIRQVSWNVKDQSVKMIYFDIDGTLREENSEITEKTKYVPEGIWAVFKKMYRNFKWMG